MNENPLDIGEIKGEVETINFDNICLCDFCQQCFTTEQQLNEHIESHLARRQCVCCNKDVIVIGGKLYMLHEPNSNCGDDNVSDKSYLAKINYQSTIVLSEIGAVQPKIEVIETKKACDVIGNKEIIEKKRNLRRRTLKKYASDSSLCSNDQNLQNKKQPRKKSEKKKSTVPSDPPVASKPISIEQQPSNGTKQFDCDLCGQQFKSINRLHYHETAVHKKKPNTECDICGRVCKTLTYLKDHKRTHSTEKQFICSYCGKGFHVKFHLKEHINTHTGEKPYKCAYCPASFNRSTLRFSHQRVHTGAKPFKCTVDGCDKAYAFSTDLKRHRRSQHQIFTNCKRFECPICSKVFYENKFLRQHMITHRNRD